MTTKTRLNKYLADRGVCSRRAADKLIEDGAVYVNGVVAVLGLTVDENDDIVVEGRPIQTTKPDSVFIAFHKPVGLITSADQSLRDNVISFINYKERIFPIGRLDVASSGLLLLTNDGRLSETITHPRYHHEKEYIVTVNRPIRDHDLEKMASGLIVLGKITKPAVVTRVDDFTFRIVLTEGRNRQIRRMCETLGYDVRKLKRIRVMNIELGDLPSGKWRHLTEKEVNVLKSLLSKKAN